MNFVSEYIKYLWKAKARHGIHSPFVYDFTDKCLTVEPDENFRIKVKSLKKELLRNRHILRMTDAGAGSRKLGKERSVRDVYKTAASAGVYADLLYQLSHHYRPARILELGTSLGLGTIYLAAGNEQATVTSVDACTDTLDQARQNIDNMYIRNIDLVHNVFLDFLEEAGKEKFDLVFLDGHHEGNALKKYMELLKPITHEDTIFVLDDIRWSQDMFEAWKQLSASAEYHLSMDLFRMGILVRRPSQQKEHFTIRLKNVLGGL